MAEECRFYFFDGIDYCCSYLKSKNERYILDHDWVRKYCWGYHYDECPYIKKMSGGSSGSSGCYLTSACVRAKSLPDNCVELLTLRWFRDNIIQTLPDGANAIEHYYSTAPQIVERINRRSNAKEEWDYVYSVIVRCVELINKKEYQLAFDMYRSMTQYLGKRYLNESGENGNETLANVF